ncbi:TIGR01777 family oxidoreductase [Psychromonas sp. MME1]|uniref:TIGR01777 family oxidoreductase n=1 Tax=Psychromonas sp. MME1 TaxID=3231032 RepID=UPI0034E28A59
MSTKKILIAGSSGLIGSALVPFLQAQGINVGRLMRHAQNEHPYWDRESDTFCLNEFNHPDIVINLAGENIANGRWSEKRKQQLLDSRIITTEKLVKHFMISSPAPKLWINASAIGFYGNRGEQELDEESPVGGDFVSQLAQQWEESSNAIKRVGTRLINLRTGLVISKDGGALAKMLPVFKFGLGGKIGNGQQIMSWIDIHDMVRAISFTIDNESLNGPVNFVSPNPISNSIFSHLLAKQLKRPNCFPLPSFMVRLLFAEMGKELLLSSTNVVPKKLIEAGFKFKYEKLEESLKAQLGG